MSLATFLSKEDKVAFFNNPEGHRGVHQEEVSCQNT